MGDVYSAGHVNNKMRKIPRRFTNESFELLSSRIKYQQEVN